MSAKRKFIEDVDEAVKVTLFNLFILVDKENFPSVQRTMILSNKAHTSFNSSAHETKLMFDFINFPFYEYALTFGLLYRRCQ